MLWRVAASLSVGAQRVIFWGMARCLPALQEGGGQLGRPLSEEPEFWRAVPDAECVDWVADELGLPTGEWDGPGSLRSGGAAGDGGLPGICEEPARGLVVVPPAVSSVGSGGALSSGGGAAVAPGGLIALERDWRD